MLPRAKLLLLTMLLAAPAWAQVVLTDGSEAPAVKEAAQSESLLLKILSALVSILAPLLAALVAKAVMWLHANEKQSKLAYAGGVAGDLFLSFLNEAKQKLLPEVQAALADGVLTGAERASLKAHLIDLLKTNAPVAVLNALKAAFGTGLDMWLSAQADRAIDSMAAEAAPASP